MDKYGLIGKNISYSFSKKYFTEKFSKEKIQATYQNFDLKTIHEIEQVYTSEKSLKGLNVTIPYKEQVIPFLDKLDPAAKEIGAVNTIKILNGKKIGYNTDCFGFTKAIYPFLEKHHKNALILGTGGASKAVAHGLRSLGIAFKFVSRNPSEGALTYPQLSEELMETYTVIINCTPLGTTPNIDDCPDIPFQSIGGNHLLFDLIYNPSVTKFLANGKMKGAKISNGQKMLEFQAEKAWEIWNFQEG